MKKKRIDQNARRRELNKLLGGKAMSSYGRRAIDPSRLVKVTLINKSYFWDHPVTITDSAYEFARMGIIPKEQVASLYFWQKPKDKERFINAIAKQDTPHFSAKDWMKELGGK